MPRIAQEAGPAGGGRLIVASGLGTLFGWYDFYLYGTLAPLLARHFFAGVDAGAAFALAMGGFAVGFLVRPLGALVFGRLGDLIGRKYSFLATLLLMAASTFCIGILPSHELIGVLAPVALTTLRFVQGLAIGGEYGGVVTYVAEHAPADRRGAHTGWIQGTATGGLLLALLVVVGTRALLGDERFEAWGWRVPFLLSAVLLAIGMWIRLRLQESPAFRRLKQAGRSSREPLAEAFGRWPNAKVVVLALFGLVAGQAVVWYTSQFHALLVLTLQLRVDESTARLMLAAALALGLPLFPAFGALSDRVGRKPVFIAGCLLAAVGYFPLFQALALSANPALAEAQSRVEVLLAANPAQCTWQPGAFVEEPVASGCDGARQVLIARAVRHERVPTEGATRVTVAGAPIDLVEGDGGASVQRLDRALDAAGYPRSADPRAIDHVKVVAILWLLVAIAAMVYGPIAAALVELFPTRVRCSSVSLPYHLGNGWFGGLLPVTALLIGAHTGHMLDGLWFPVVVASLGALAALALIPETHRIDIYARDEEKP